MINSVSPRLDWPSNSRADILAGIIVALAVIQEATILIAGAEGLIQGVSAAVVGRKTPNRKGKPQTLLAPCNSPGRAIPSTDRTTMVERIGGWIAHRLLSGPWGESLSYNLARLGLHGLGIAPPFDFERSGEQRIYTAILRKIPDARCLDVGASAGGFTTMLVDLGAAHVVAAEPIPSTFNRLENNTSSLGNVDLVCCAVGERDGQISIDVPEGDEYSTLSSRDISVTDVADHRHGTEIVPLRSIDSLVEEHSWRFDIVKIDVEGFELEVLEGAARLLADDPPTILQFEFNSHHGRRGQHLKTLTDLLPGYALYRIAPRSLRPIDPEHYLSCIYTYQNILAVRRDRTDLIATH